MDRARWDDDYHRELMDAGLVDVNDLEDQRREYRRHAPPRVLEKIRRTPPPICRKNGIPHHGLGNTPLPP